MLRKGSIQMWRAWECDWATSFCVTSHVALVLFRLPWWRGLGYPWKHSYCPDSRRGRWMFCWPTELSERKIIWSSPFSSICDWQVYVHVCTCVCAPCVHRLVCVCRCGEGDGEGEGGLCNCVCLIFIPLTGDQGLLCWLQAWQNDKKLWSWHRLEVSYQHQVYWLVNGNLKLLLMIRGKAVWGESFCGEGDYIVPHHSL